MRPQNHPVRRLAAAAALFGRNPRLTTELAGLDTKDPRSWFEQARRLFAGRARMPYWDRRLSFSSPAQDRRTALLGPERVSAILSNIAVPFLAATDRPVAGLLDRLPPEHDNALIRRTAAVLLGRDHNPALYRHGLRQQGLLQVFHDFCLTNRTACRDCGLPELLRSRPAAPPGRSP